MHTRSTWLASCLLGSGIVGLSGRICDGHAISGRIIDAGNHGVAGIIVSGNNGAKTDISRADGYYTLQVPDRWSGTITPQHRGLRFIPANRSYERITDDRKEQDFRLESGQTVATGPPPATSPAARDVPDTAITAAARNRIQDSAASGSRRPSTRGKASAPSDDAPGGPASTTTQQSGSSTQAATFEATILDGQAPLTVLFNASHITLDEPIADYAWDFGDDLSAHTAEHGTFAGQKINTRFDHGRLAAHRFDQPGDYMVRLTLTTASRKTRTVSRSITVHPFSGRTYYVKTGGSDSLSGITEEWAWATLAKVQSAISKGFVRAGDRVLFRRGDVFEGTISLGATFKGTRAAPITLGAYGEGKRPELRQGKDSKDVVLQFHAMRSGSAVVLDNLFIHRTESTSPTLFTYASAGPVHPSITIRHCEIEGGYDGFTCLSRNVLTVEECLVHGARRQGMKIDTPYTLIRNTLFHKNGTSTVLDHNIYFTDSNHSLVEHCSIESGSGGGITAHGVISNLVIRNSIVRANDVGINITAGYASTEGFTDCVIESNRVHSNKSMGVYMNSWIRGVVRNNLLYNNGSHNGQINLSSGIAPDALLTGTVIANNVLYGAGNSLDLALADDSDCVFKNNICWCTSGAHTCLQDLSKGGSLTSDYNLFFSPKSSDFSRGKRRSFADWLAAGNDPHGQNADPRLTDPERGDFSPGTGSPCIGAGQPLWQVYRDFTGAVRTTADIGAYQFTPSLSDRR